MVEFAWDPDKELSNMQKHGVDFTEAATVFGDPWELTIPDPHHSIGECRFLNIAHSSRSRILVDHILNVSTVSVLSVLGRHHQRNGDSMSQKDEQDTMREEYDFSGGVRGKHYEAYRQGTNLVLLEPDVAKIFKDSATVNSALRMLAKIAQEYVPTPPKG
jgi:uncharacterized DUF497 family protein